jgi:hypothetical protein
VLAESALAAFAFALAAVVAELAPNVAAVKG